MSVDLLQASCPVPLADYSAVMMAHGGGGRMMHQLIESVFAVSFGLPSERERHDSAVLDIAGKRRLAFTTDSFVVKPLFFAGGDIGSLAVNGTVNDLAMAGARPMWLSAGFILEEGLPMETLWKVARSMRAAADAAGVRIVTGDTKVVDRGKGDGIYINTSGAGVIDHELSIGPARIRPDDAVILSGDIGRHGVAIMAQREGLEFETTIESDCAPLNRAVAAMLDEGIAVHCMRDLTRGGLASGLVEIAAASGAVIRIDERAVPVAGQVAAACEILGLDPMYVANEGCFVSFVPSHQADRALAILRRDPACGDAVRIGSVASAAGCAPDRIFDAPAGHGVVLLKSAIGVERVLDLLSGEQLPRIC